ncbi:MAG TPA: hydantoinase/oxoprolinase family protein [Burkholderiales bacterium]|nr:hydantoinase/oxoprolinase family protein [Burkholderiales bacterium]
MATTTVGGARLAVDIGGTFTDIVLDARGKRWTGKVLTTPRAPEEAVLAAVQEILAEAGLKPGALELFILGTTLATNALIERKGARTALVTTEGFRDLVEIGWEHRFAQYDIFLDKPEPLVPRYLRLPVPERIDARGRVLLPLDERALEAIVPVLQQERIESVAVAFLQSFVNPAHERRAREILKSAMPDLWITISSDVCPEIREYERISTACANAYVQPVMAGYLNRLEGRLKSMDVTCPVFLMTSGGALATMAMGAAEPVRLVESGPAGGAILARNIAESCGAERALSFDMGGTTAKICFIDDYEPEISRSFEFGRVYRFMKGSGLPLRIPVIEMVEIGAGGGSIARVDDMERVQVGPDSAGSEPGPACYARGGEHATVTDADCTMGMLDPERFAGGRVRLEPARAEAAVQRDVAKPLKVNAAIGALAISEIVTENMANAARVHAMELGKTVEKYTLIAFGGAAPLHAARLADKLGVERVIIPVSASVGSALGFLTAPVAFQAVRSWYQLVAAIDTAHANRLLGEMEAQATEVVRTAAGDAPLTTNRIAYMRYAGQGHEIPVSLPAGELVAGAIAELAQRFDEAYRALYGRVIPNMAVEIMSWSVTVSTQVERAPAAQPLPPAAAEAVSTRRMFEPKLAKWLNVPVYERRNMPPGAQAQGPALIVEDQTTVVVTSDFDAAIDSLGYIVLDKRPTKRK